jgi:hypothetical protein
MYMRVYYLSYLVSSIYYLVSSMNYYLHLFFYVYYI